MGRTNRFVRLLGVLRFGRVNLALMIGVAVFALNGLFDFIKGLDAQVGAVGTHITDITGLIEFLRQSHRNRRGVAQTGRSGLLEGRGSEGSARLTAHFALLYRTGFPISLLRLSHN